MAARKPEDCDNLLIEALNTGDLEAAVACYEPDASFVVEPGKVVTGHAAIREVLESWLALKPKLTIEANAVQSGDVALLRSKWTLKGTGSDDGKPVEMSGNGTEVVRRQTDGSWLFIIDNPAGAD